MSSITRKIVMGVGTAALVLGTLSATAAPASATSWKWTGHNYPHSDAGFTECANEGYRLYHPQRTSCRDAWDGNGRMWYGLYVMVS